MNQPTARLKVQTFIGQPFFLFHVIATVSLWAFVWWHAYAMDIISDEATSYLLLKIGNYRALPGVANTHWLNSFFMQLTMLFTNSTLCLRLHSIIAFPFFAHGIYRLATYIKSDGARFAFYCLVVFNLYILDFFALARGYGMALTFQVWTIIIFIKAVHTEFDYRRWLTIVLLSALAIGSNLSYQYTIMAIASGYLLHCMITDAPFSWYTNKQKRRVTLLFALLLFLTTVDLLFVKFYGKDLEFGGKANFLQSVFESFWVKSLYQAGYTSISTVLSWCTFALLVIASLYFSVKAIRQKKLTTGVIAAFIIGAILLLGIIFHLLINTPFISNRTSLQWYVPGLFAIFLAIGEWGKQATRYRFVKYSLGLVTGMAVMFHFVTRSNSHLSMEYSTQKFNRQPLYDLYALHPQHPNLTAWIAGVYKCYYSLADSLNPKAGMFWEYPDRPLDIEARQTLLASDYIICNSPVTLQYLDSVNIPYAVIKTYKGNSYKIVRLYH
jgi:hypothetical protein